MFITHQYNYSLIRKIKSDNWIGIGAGLKFIFNWGKLSLSYATIYQNSEYFIIERETIFRHSVRTKIKLEKKNVCFSSEYFFQPNMFNFKDVIIYGTSKISLSTGKSVSFVIQDVVNYRSSSSVETVHNLSLGIGYKFNKKVSLL
jgi:hypothetical protein